MPRARSLIPLALVAAACVRSSSTTAPFPVAADAGSDAGVDAASHDASHTIVSVRLGGSNSTGGVDLVLTPDGAAKATYFNRGFSKAGGEVYTHENKVGPDQVAAIWRAATVLAEAVPTQQNTTEAAADGGSVAIRFSDGREARVEWTGKRHPDSRVADLAALLEKTM